MPQVEDGGLDLGGGPPGGAGDGRPIAPIDAIEASSFGPLDPTLDGGEADLEVTGYRAKGGVGATRRLDYSPSVFGIGVGFLMLRSSKRAGGFCSNLPGE